MRASVIVVMIALAGCLDEPSAGTPPEPERSTSGTANQSILEFHDCLGVAVVVIMPAPWVQQHLPAGYEPVDSANPWPIALECGGVSLDNASLGPASVGWTAVLVQSGGFYLFELFVGKSDPRLHEALMVGLEPMAAGIETDGTTGSIEAADINYELGTLGLGPATDRSFTYHFDHMAQNGTVRSLIMEFDVNRHNLPPPGTIQAEGGVFGAFGPIDDAPWVGTGDVWRGDMTWIF